MNEVLVERHQAGLAGLRSLLEGKHLRPRELALMVAAFVALPVLPIHQTATKGLTAS